MAVSNNGSVFQNLRNDVAAAAAKAAGAVTSITERKASDFWLNIGIWIAGPVNADGTPGDLIFVSLPTGLPLDDMKPQAIKGTNQDWINLAQTKNEVLEFLQKHAGSMEPGERQPLGVPTVGHFGVEIYRRRNEPAQQGTTTDNPLMASLFASLGKQAA